MLVTVRERTREIGVRRAVGATRRDIVVQFLVDAVVISLIGGVIGLALGFAGAFAGGSALDVTPVFSWTAVILAIVVAIAVGVLAASGPRRRPRRWSRPTPCGGSDGRSRARAVRSRLRPPWSSVTMIVSGVPKMSPHGGPPMSGISSSISSG